MITPEDLENWFTYHSPTPEQLPKYKAIREAGKAFAQAIVENTPSSADQTAAIRKVREAVMTANQSIAPAVMCPRCRHLTKGRLYRAACINICAGCASELGKLGKQFKRVR